MDESFPGYNPALGNTAQLPQDFLGVDQQRLQVSAERQRGMADLRQGLDRLNENFPVRFTVTDGCRSWEKPDAVRHVNRGAALAQILVEDSAPGFAPDPMRHIHDAKDDLMEARRSAVLAETWRLPPDEAAQNESILRSQVDEILARAGLGEHFEAALRGLTGDGLKEATRELDAKYGAALVALGIGITGDSAA